MGRVVGIGGTEQHQLLVRVELSEDDRWPGWAFVLHISESGTVARFDMWNEVDADAEVTSTLLRTVKVDELRRVARKFWAQQLRLLADGEGPMQPSPALATQLRTTAAAGDERRLLALALTVRDYLRRCDDPNDPAPTRSMAEAEFVSTRAIQKRIRKAEEFGLYVKGHGLRPGGQLTDLAVQVLRSNGEEVR